MAINRVLIQFFLAIVGICATFAPQISKESSTVTGVFALSKLRRKSTLTLQAAEHEHATVKPKKPLKNDAADMSVASAEATLDAGDAEMSKTAVDKSSKNSKAKGGSEIHDANHPNPFLTFLTTGKFDSGALKDWWDLKVDQMKEALPMLGWALSTII